VASQQQIPRFVVMALLGAGAVIGGTATQYGCAAQPSVPAEAQATTANAGDVERLNKLVPSQSHAMSDVGQHWSNLWFAGQQKNWPLAQFYFNETRSHIQWTINIRPIRKDQENRDVDLQAIFSAVDASTLAAVKMAIALKDSERFDKAYRESLEGCYSCHKASGMPFLRPVVPSAPGQTIIDFAPLPAAGTS
jgi:hypothetical protein